MDHEAILSWLTEDDPSQLEDLWTWADHVRQQCVGDEVHLRGLIEISNHCARDCWYCGLRYGHQQLRRYRLSTREIMSAVGDAQTRGYGTVVLQSGEDPELDTAFIARLVEEIKATTPLAVTLSLGERRVDELAQWRQAGADRYLLKFETSNEALYRRVHPGWAGRPGRMELLRELRDLGYEVGSGVMVGLPGQRHEDLATDILRFGELELDMVGVGPFIPHPRTPLAHVRAVDQDHVVPGDLMTLKTMALTRIIRPLSNIPTTTALSTVNAASGLEMGLQRGANVVMPNLTPMPYRELYQVYPGKGGNGTHREDGPSIERRIKALGRSIGSGRGDAPAWVIASAGITCEV